VLSLLPQVKQLAGPQNQFLLCRIAGEEFEAMAESVAVPDQGT